jgi:hypothetical protein
MANLTDTGHQLRFPSLSRASLAFVFPCDASGRVDLDRLSDRARNDYHYARAMIGREVAAPRVVTRAPAW